MSGIRLRPDDPVDILYLLIPLSTLMVLAILGVFAWALQGGQFDELEREGARILDAAQPPLDAHQTAAASGTEESNPEQAQT